MSAQQRVAFTHSRSLLHPASTITSIVEKITTGVVCRQRNEERRSAKRYSVVTIVEAQSLDDERNLTGEPFQAVTRDISASGISLTHNQDIASKYLAVQLTSPEGSQIQTIVEVTRSRPLGSMWDIAGKFLTDVDGN